jgi:signal transduction histidine kinase
MNDLLRNVPLLAGLAEADLERLCRLAEEVRLPAGQVLFLEGSAGNKAYVILEGEVEVVKESSGRQVLLAVRPPGDVSGEMALMEGMPRTATVRARTDVLLLALSKEQFDALLATSLSAAQALFHTVLSRWRSTEAVLRQSERMVQLGTLTAGVAHELNNPAAAVKRNADQLLLALAALEDARSALESQTPREEQRRTLQAMAQALQEAVAHPLHLDPMARSDREAELQEWLETRGVEDAWNIAPNLVSMGYGLEGVKAMAGEFPPPQLGAALGWLVATYSVQSLVFGIGLGAGRISDIVKALKSYSYLDQAPVQDVDVQEGLEQTLLLLAHKLRSNIAVRREYAPALPKINGYGSELNQVWTNIIDNAADALEGRQGTIILRTRTEDGWVVVEIEDDGPGIKPEVQPRIFDAFFTTKPPGKGTGLGLNISYNIVVHKHRGEIKVTSQPGKTCFQVRLPVGPSAR